MDVELIKNACFICCPMCDEDVCVGRYNCREIKDWVEEHKEEE